MIRIIAKKPARVVQKLVITSFRKDGLKAMGGGIKKMGREEALTLLLSL